MEFFFFFDEKIHPEFLKRALQRQNGKSFSLHFAKKKNLPNGIPNNATFLRGI